MSTVSQAMITKANSSARESDRAVVPPVVRQLATKSDFILDYGAGPKGFHAHCLKVLGYPVIAYDFGDNYNETAHDSEALDWAYDIVYASNVLNVQGSAHMLGQTLREIYGVLNTGGKFIFNFPASPRYGAFDKYKKGKEQERYLMKRIKAIWGHDTIVDMNENTDVSTPVYMIKKI